MTEHQQIFYEGREEDTTFLRVHGIPAVMSFLDYSAAATGMTYRNNNNPAGVTIDGVADSVAAGRAHVGERGRRAGRAHERPHLEHHGGREQVHLVLPRPGEPARGPDPVPGRRRLLRRQRPLRERLDQLDRRARQRQRPRRPPDLHAHACSSTRPGPPTAPLRRQQVTARLTTNVDPPPVTPPPTGGTPPVVAPPVIAPPVAEQAQGRQALAAAPLPPRARLRAARGRAHAARAQDSTGCCVPASCFRSRELATDRSRPFRLAVTKKRLRGHRARARGRSGARLRGGRLVTVKRRVRGLC